MPQRVSVFAASDVPLSVAIAIDRSFSMRGPWLAAAKSAAATFLRSLRTGDEASVLAVGSQVELVAPLSRDRAAQIDAVSSIDAFGTTSLYDSVRDAIEATREGKGRRVLILMSDAADRYSAGNAAAALDVARSSEVLVYPVALGIPSSTFFDQLAALTGGRPSYVRNARDLTATLNAIGRELRFQYLLGYTPTDGPDRGWRTIAVTVNRPNVTVRARNGYYRQ